MDSTPIPSTPPGQKTSVFSGPYTPKSTSSHHRHRRSAKSLRTPKNTPFIDAAPRSRDALFEGAGAGAGATGATLSVPPPPDFASVKSPVTPKSLPGLSLFLPTPSTVGTGRKPRAEKVQFRKSPKSKLLLERLQAAVEEDHESEGGRVSGLKESAIVDEKMGESTPKSQVHASFASKTEASSLSPSEIDGMSLFSPQPLRKCSQELHEVVNTPRTPTQNIGIGIGIEQKPQFEPFFDTDSSMRVVTLADVDKIPRYEVPNPFRDCSLTASSRSKSREKVDYSTHLELVNSRTGERKVEVLSEAQRRFKPKKLDFTSAVESPKTPKTPKTPDYRIANKYLENSIGKNFSMNSTRPKGSLDFEIFKD